MSRRFPNPQGVQGLDIDYGKTDSAPFYEPMYEALEAAGYVRDKNIRVAGYDPRLTPDMGGFLGRTKRLIEDTYHDNGRRPVHLVGHSNGPCTLSICSLTRPGTGGTSTSTASPRSQATSQGRDSSTHCCSPASTSSDFTFPTTQANARSSARMYLAAPSSYMSAADPRIFGRREIVLRDATTERSYTPADFKRLLTMPACTVRTRSLDHYIGFVRFADPGHSRTSTSTPSEARESRPPSARRSPTSASAKSSMHQPTSSRATATSIRKTSPTSPCEHGGRCDASISASPTTPASTTSPCPAIPACSTD